MFTGIVETIGTVKEVIINGSNASFWISSPLSESFKIDESISHSGICLTVEEVVNSSHKVTAVAETIEKTNIAGWTAGTKVNIERSLPLNGRLDGHFVQGHVDTTGICIEKVEKAGSWEFVFRFPDKFAALIIEKGSVAVNGISLTAFDVTQNSFKVAIIPYTYEHTNMNDVLEGETINLEFDIIGKYITRSRQLRP
jgi:riboflavin synthase